ncbi:MAG: hypothetical protein AB1422_04810 [bacterium]
MTKKIILGYVIVSFLIGSNINIVGAQTQETITISAKELIERLSRIEENQRSLQRQIDDNQKNLQRQIDNNQKSLQRQIDELRNDLKWGFGIICGGMFALLGGMVALVGFVMWDRRTALSPAVKRIKIVEEQEKKIEKVLREYAGQEIKFAQAMRAAGLL